MAADAHSHSPMTYVKIWAVLLGLLIVSLIGPEIGILWVTLVTAFGIAIVKALMVAAYFMHLNIEKRFIWYMLFSMLLMVFLFFIAVSVDVMKPDGQNWTNEAAHQLIQEHAEGQKAAGEHHE